MQEDKRTMHLFPGLQWAEELAKRLNSLTEYRDSSENWKGTLVMAVLGEPGKLDKDVAIGLDPTGGVIRDVRLVDNHKTAPVDFVLAGKYSFWKDVLLGKHDIIGGVVTGKVRLRGNVFRLMLQLKTPDIIIREMRELPRKFIDEA
jgi:putative sterol carrier protein